MVLSVRSPTLSKNWLANPALVVPATVVWLARKQAEFADAVVHAPHTNVHLAGKITVASLGPWVQAGVAQTQLPHKAAHGMVIVWVLHAHKATHLKYSELNNSRW